MAFDYEYINTYEGTRSPNGKVIFDKTTAYFMRCLYQRAISTIKFKLPKTWNKQYFTNVLFRNGFISVIDSPKYGIIPQICTLTGYGLYLQPTNVLVAQPLVRFQGEIGTDCELIKLTPDYMGITDIVDHYAVQLSTCFTSINMSLENSRLAVLLGAKDKAAAETLKYIAERISAGESVIVFDKYLQDDAVTGNSKIWEMSYDVKNNYITDKLLSDLQTIVSQFDREIGIPSIDQKRERYVTEEVNVLTADSSARLSTWRDCLSETIDNVNALYAGRLEPIEFRTILEEVGEYELKSENNTDRDV